MPFLFQPKEFQENSPEAIDARNRQGFFAGLKPFLQFVGTSGAAASGGYGGNNIMSTTPTTPTVTGNPTVDAILAGINQGKMNTGSGNPSTPNNGSNADFLKYLLPILAGITGGLDNRATKQTTNPLIPENTQPLQNSLIDKYMSLLNEDPDLSGYVASGTQDLNRTADSQKRMAEETFAARGVNGPAVATGLNSIDANRYSGINKLKLSAPLLSRDLKSQALSSAGGFFNSSPRGSVTEGNGNVLGGAIGGSTELLAYLYGLGKI